MIDLGQPVFHGEGVLVFADHADRARFYYLPDVPRVTRGEDGAPALRLLEYRYDAPLEKALGAGLLSFSVDLGVDADRLERIAGKVAKQAGLTARPALGPVVADAARCELVLLDRSSAPPADAPAPPVSGMVERILGGSTPSLYGDNTTTFMAVFDANGVAVVEASIAGTGAGLPIGVVYTLDVLALRPAIRATVTARWDQVYRYYENRLHGGKLLLAADIGETVRSLVHDEAITVQVDDLVPPDQVPAVFDRAVDEVQRYVVQEFFKPSLTDAPPPDAAADGPLAVIGNTVKDLAGMFSFTYSLRDVDRTELKTFTFHLQGSSAEKLVLSPQGTLSLLLRDPAAPPDAPPLNPSRFITRAAATASPEMDFDVGSAIDLAGDAIDHLEVRLAYGDRREVVVLDPAAPRKTVSFWYDAALGPSIAVGWDVHFAPSSEGPAEVLHGPDATTDGRVVRIDPRAAYRRVALRLVCAGVPFDRYPQVIADVEADDPATGWSRSQTLTLDAQHPDAAVTVRVTGASTPRFRRRLRYVAPSGEETPVDWAIVDPGVAIVGDPHPDILDVQILGSARFGTEVSKLVVELRPAARPDEVATRVLTAAAPSATWSVALGDGQGQGQGQGGGYEYRVTVFTTRSEVREGQWLAANDGTLVVGEGIARLRAVSMVFVGKTPKDLGLLALKVRFHFADPAADLVAEDELLVADATKPLAWSYPVADPARAAYDWTLTLVHGDGRIETRPAVTTSDLLVVVPLT